MFLLQKKEKTRQETPQLSSDLKALCVESVNAASNDAANKVSFGKKGGKKDFNSLYVDARNQEIDLQKDRFNWERQNYDAQKIAKEKASEAELLHKEKTIFEETKRTQLTLAEKTRRAIILQGMKQGLTPEAIEEFTKELLG